MASGCRERISYNQSRMMTDLRFMPIAVSVLVLFLAGCRTYGDYGSVDKTVDKISEANEAFARAYERAQSNAEALRRAAQTNTAVVPYAEKYEMVVAEHGHMVDQHAEAFDALPGTVFRYAASNRLLGAIVSEQNMIGNRYAEIARDAARVVGLDSSDDPRPASNYSLVPPYFERIRHSIGSRGLDDVIRRTG